MDMGAVTSFVFCRGNQLGIKAASYQQISLIHSVGRIQQKAECLLLLLLNCVQFIKVFYLQFTTDFKLSIGK